jgi:hypothetical protein
MFLDRLDVGKAVVECDNNEDLADADKEGVRASCEAAA